MQVEVYQTAQAAADAAVAVCGDLAVPGTDFEVLWHDSPQGWTWIDARPDGAGNTAEAELRSIEAADRAALDDDEDETEPVPDSAILAEIGLTEALVAAVLAQADREREAAARPRKGRRNLFAEALAAAPSGTIPECPIGSEVNYTYGRHAAALKTLAEAGDLDGLRAYPCSGKNTYARRLARYRDALVAHLGRAA